MEPIKLTAYNVRTKEKNVEILDPVITRTARGAYMVQGHSATGDKLTTLLGEQKAFQAVRQGVASANGFEVPPADPAEDEHLHATQPEERGEDES